MKPDNKNQIRINNFIRSKLVRVILPDGEQLGVLPIMEALKRAQEFKLDLVEISPQANPPVCKILDYGKFKYEASKKQKEQKKSANPTITKTVQFSPNTGENDLLRKVSDIKKFLEKSFQVVAIVTMEGRETSHPEIAFQQIRRIEELVGVAPLEKAKRQNNKISVVFKNP